MSEQNHSAEIGKLAEALSKAQGEIKGVIKDSANPFFHSTYASLAACLDVCRKPLSDNGLAIVQAPMLVEGKIRLKTILIHISGEWISCEYPIEPMRQVKDRGWEISNDPQSMGSAVSYARRYCICSMIGMAPDDGTDDDGNLATGKKNEKPYRTAKPETEELARTGQIYSEQTNNLIRQFDLIGIKKGELEDILKHDLTKVSEDEKDMLRGIYAEKVKGKKGRKPSGDKEKLPKSEPPVKTFAEKIYEPHLEYCHEKLGWDNITIEGWYRGKGIEDPSTLNDVELAEIMKQLEVEKKCQPFPRENLAE